VRFKGDVVVIHEGPGVVARLVSEAIGSLSTPERRERT
jgi:hypothetical protein